MKIFREIANKDYVRIHGPEHHVLNGTGPLSTDGSWGRHMEFSSAALAKMAEINGPRCCKRDGFVALTEAVRFINANYDVTLEMSEIKCRFSPRNAQCIKERCPYFVG